MAELVSFVLLLKQVDARPLTARHGRAVSAALLAHIAEQDSALFALLHDGDGPKPYTCSGLLAAETLFPAPAQVQKGLHAVRVTGLTEAASNGLLDTLYTRRPATLKPAGHHFVLLPPAPPQLHLPDLVELDYGDLLGRNLLPGPGSHATVDLEFVSLTSFRSNKIAVPLPMPAMVFGSLADRWARFGPQPLLEGFRQKVEQTVVVSRFGLHSEVENEKNGTPQIGCVGRVVYRCLEPASAIGPTMRTLADYAFFSGVGINTTVGMGQCHRIQ